jgi:hypothetical protein
VNGLLGMARNYREALRRATKEERCRASAVIFWFDAPICSTRVRRQGFSLSSIVVTLG